MSDSPEMMQLLQINIDANQQALEHCPGVFPYVLQQFSPGLPSHC